MNEKPESPWRKVMREYVPDDPAAYDPFYARELEEDQCAKVADVDYGVELRCSNAAGHEGKCQP